MSLSSTCPTECCRLRKHRYLQKANFHPKLCPKLWAFRFRNDTSIGATCCQLRSTECVINWTVVGRTKLTPLATVDGQFITLSVHRCLQTCDRPLRHCVNLSRRQHLRNALFDALYELSGTHYRKLFSVVTLLQFLSLG